MGIILTNARQIREFLEQLYCRLAVSGIQQCIGARLKGCHLSHDRLAFCQREERTESAQ